MRNSEQQTQSRVEYNSFFNAISEQLMVIGVEMNSSNILQLGVSYQNAHAEELIGFIRATSLAINHNIIIHTINLAPNQAAPELQTEAQIHLNYDGEYYTPFIIRSSGETNAQMLEEEVNYLNGFNSIHSHSNSSSQHTIAIPYHNSIGAFSSVIGSSASNNISIFINEEEVESIYPYYPLDQKGVIDF